MTTLMPLRRAVVEITGEAAANDDTAIRKAVKAWHNRLSNGSIPRTMIVKLGRKLFLDLHAWEDWCNERFVNTRSKPLGRPRNGGGCGNGFAEIKNLLVKGSKG